MSNRSILLQATSLFSKYGFGDGDMLGDWEEYNDFTPLPEPWASVEVELSEHQIRDIADEVLAEQYGRKA